MSEITLVNIGTINHRLVKKAINHTLENTPVKVKEILTFSDQPIISGERFIKIDKLNSIEEYSNFVLKNLNGNIKTDCFLLIQYDGFAIKKENWTNDFLKFDYIGAPWVKQKGVGNGGFSLRSQKLIDALLDNEIKLLPEKPDGINEDRVICEYYKNYLIENYNIKFADIDIASKFSIEKGKPNQLLHSFGFHGLWNLPYLFSEKYCIDFFKKLKVNKRTSGRIIKACRKMKYNTLIEKFGGIDEK